jgi:hypothetical protein
MVGPLGRPYEGAADYPLFVSTFIQHRSAALYDISLRRKKRKKSYRTGRKTGNALGGLVTRWGSKGSISKLLRNHQSMAAAVHNTDPKSAETGLQYVSPMAGRIHQSGVSYL